MRKRPGWMLLWLLLAAFPARHTSAADGDVTHLQPWWKLADFDGDAALEGRLFEMVNDERRKAKLPLLELLPELQTAARQHSTEMRDEAYFAHDSPHSAWRSPAERAYRSGYWEAFVAENVAFLDTRGASFDVEQTARFFMYGDHGWMNSPAHRENILSPDYSHIGIGVASHHGMYYGTQVFGHHYYEFSEVVLEERGNSYELAARAKLVGQTSQVHIGLDSELLETIPVNQGDTFRFKVAVPRDGGHHKIGVHPHSEGNRYWVKFLFFVDTSRPVDRALVMPFKN